jgi:phosphoglycolate phosphatase-like HAD superfamily hydrolase
MTPVEVFSRRVNSDQPSNGINKLAYLSVPAFIGKAAMESYTAMISSDWNQCLAPCGPFDAIAYHYPELQTQLDRIFRQYTANTITLGQASEAIAKLLPAPLAPNQMDVYLQNRFATYTGVQEFIQWCSDRQILFMINTTGLAGYFQRALALGLLPAFGVLAAHSLVRYGSSPTDPRFMLELEEITDKPRHTAATARQFHIALEKIIIMGDSGGDGPHFQWGARNGATLIGSMVKPSLERYCTDQGVAITHRWGHVYTDGETIDPEKEMGYALTDLIGIVEQILERG